MAGFGDSNDIKINVTLDTEAAVKAAQDLKTAIENSLKATETQFQKLQQLSRGLSSALVEQSKAAGQVQIANTKQVLDQTVAANAAAADKAVKISEETAAKKVRAEKKAQEQILEAQRLAVRQAEAENKKLEIAQKEAHAKSLERIAELNLKAALVRKTRRSELPDGLGGIASSGKGLQTLGNVAVSVTTRFGLLTATTRTLGTALAALGPVGLVFGALATGAVVFGAAVNKLNEPIDKLAKQAGNLEGLKTGFETLQRSVGQDPAASINKLREATQGLISDTELYQRANQAVLLGVPTETFNQAAAAAVKLGRAMGIDAAFGLESLSLGLGRQSRLYLDNLGIVVSAEEAYLRFAQANNIVGRTLTDSEKKAAFFEEALRKIKERADELPEILDSVGIALKKVEVAQANVSAKFLEGFNRNTDLAKSYGEQAKLIQGSADTFERLGAITGAIGAKLKNLQNVLVGLGLTLLTDVTKGIDSAFSISKQQQYEDTAEKIAIIEQKIKDTTEALNDPNLNKAFLPGLKRSLAESEVELATAKKALEDLGAEIGVVQVQGANGIKIKVDLTDLNAAKLRLAGFIDELQAEVLAAGGEFEIPGLSKDTISTALKGYEELIKARELGLVGAEDAKQRLSEIIDPVALELQQTKLKDINNQIAILTTEQVQLTVATGKGSDEISNQIKALEAQRGAVQKGAGVSEEALEKLKKAYKNAGTQGVKSANEVKSALQRQAKESISAAKKQSDQWDSFLTSLNRQLKVAIAPDIQKRLAEVFRTTAVGSSEMTARLQELGAEVQKRKGDLNALAKEAGDYLEVAQRGGPILDTAEQSKAAADALDDQKAKLQQIQKSMLNLREIFTGAKEGGGGFFGFDLGTAFDAESEAQLAGSVQNALSTAFSLAVDGFTRDDVPELAGAIGGAIGTAVGAYFGGQAGGQAGAVIGTELGKIVGDALKTFGDDTQGTKERKKIDDYFAELFDGDRLGVVIEGEVFKATQQRKKGGLGRAIGTGLGIAASAVLPGISVAIGYGVGAIVDDAANQTSQALKEKIPPTFVQLGDLVFNGFTRFAGDVRFGVEEASKGFNAFSSYFETLPANVRASFTGVGVAFGELLGVATEQSLLIGTALANNIGGSLQNLQILVMQTGESLGDLSEKILKSFLDSKLSIQDAYNALLQLNNIFEKGIPGVVDYQQAIDNVVASFGKLGEAAKPGLMGVDSLRDIGTEAIQAGASFDFVINKLAQSFGFGANQVQLLFVALQSAGINSLQSLEGASETLLLSILERIRQIREGIATTAGQVSAIPVLPDIKQPSAPRSSGPPKKSPEQIALEKLREETKKLLRDSIEYENILKKITSGELSRAAAGAEIIKLQTEIQNALKRRTDLETALEKELDKGRKANKKRLADLAAQLDAVNEKIEGFKKKAEATTRVFKELDLKGVIPFIKDANNLGVIMKQVGVSFEKASDILVKGFLQGRLSLAELRAELDKTKETLGPGIPNAVGAVTDAFQNLIDAGTQGGQFSVDAFTDIFAEFREKFQKEGSALREAERKQLNQNLAAAREAFANAVGPEATAAAKKTLDEAKKALDDFYAAVPAPDLADLRDQLQAAFGREEVDKFFQALDESGLKTFDDFEKAGTDSVVGILTKLQELGFNFGQTSQDIIDAQTKLQEAEKEANAGLDPMQEAINLIKGLNEGAAQLPPVFNATTQAIESLNGPLGSLASGFDDIIEKVAKLSGQTFENDVVFNIRTTGDSTGKALVDILFGNGEGTTQDVPNTTSGNPPAGDSAPTSKKDKWVRVGPGLYKNVRTGKTVKSKTNPGRR